MNKSEQKALEELRELESLVPQIPEHENDLNFQLMLAELVDQIQDVCPVVRQSAELRKLVAQFGDAYFFYNQTGDFCLLTDFLQDAKIAENKF